MKKTKQFLALLLSASLAVTPVPLPVLAADPEAPVSTEEEYSIPAAPDYVDPTWEGYYPTDGPIEMLVGSSVPLYEISAQDYRDGKIQIRINGGAVRAVTEEGCDYVKLLGVEEGYVSVKVLNSDGSPYLVYDYAGRALSDIMVNVAKSSAHTKTCTRNGGVWVKPGESKRIAFWNPTDMQDKGAQYAVYQGNPNGEIQAEYEKGSGFITVTGVTEGEVTLEIYEERTEEPCFIKITIGGEAPTERIPTAPATTAVYTTTTDYHLPATDIELSTTTTELYTTTTEEMYPSSIACYAPKLTYDKSPMLLGATRRIHVENPEYGKVKSASITNKLNFEWYFDEENSDIVITAKQPCNALPLMIYASDCAFGDQIFLTILDQEMDTNEVTGAYTTEMPSTTTTAVYSTVVYTNTGGGTFTSLEPIYTTEHETQTETTAPEPDDFPPMTTTQGYGFDAKPVLTYDKSPLEANETRRIHVEHVINGKVPEATLLCEPFGAVDWAFDAETSDIIFTPKVAGQKIYLGVAVPGCAFTEYFSLNVNYPTAPTTAPIGSETLPATTTTTTTRVASDPNAVTLNGGAVEYENSVLEHGMTRRVHVTFKGEPVRSVQVKEVPPIGSYDLRFDSDTSDLLVHGSGAGPVNLIVVPEGDSGGMNVMFDFVEMPTTMATDDQPDPYYTTTPEPKTDPTESSTDPTEPTTEPVHFITVTMLDADESPMHVGEVRAVRFWDPETGTAKDCELEYDSDNAVCRYEKGSDTFYITALQAGELNLSISAKTTHLPATLHLNITAAKSAEPSAQTLGNLNEDTAVNAGDAAEILKEAARVGTGSAHLLNGMQRAAADVNFDGAVNAKDAACVLVYAAVKGTNDAVPEFPQYMAARRGKPVLGNVAVYSNQLVSYDFLPEGSGWSTVTTDDLYGGKFRTVTNAAQFAELVKDFSDRSYERFSGERESIQLSDLTKRYTSGWFASCDLIVVAANAGLSERFYEVRDITADAQNNWTVELQAMLPSTGEPSISGHLIMIEVNKAVEGAASLTVHQTGGHYDYLHHFGVTSVYSRSTYNSYTVVGKPVVIGSSEELSQYFPDKTQRNWKSQNSANPEELFTAGDAETLYGVYDSQALLYLREEVGSGSYRLYVKDILRDDEGNYTVRIVKQIPEVCDCAMAHWEFLLPVSREMLDAKSVTVEYTNYYLVNGV